MSSASMTIEPKKKKLPLNTTVANLKLMCKRSFKVRVEDQALTYTSLPGDLPIELDDEDRPISWYGFVENGVVMMHDKNDL